MNDNESTILRSAQSYRESKQHKAKKSPVITHEELALQMAEFERKHGKVKTSPIVVRVEVSHTYQNLAAKNKMLESKRG